MRSFGAGTSLGAISKKMIVSASLAMAIAGTTGCSTTTVRSWGSSILQTVGLRDGPSKFVVGADIMPEEDGISEENEYYLGRAVAAKILGLYEREEDAELQEYLNYVLAVVAASSERPVVFSGYRVVVIDSDELNAMSAPSGFIFVSKGLLSLISDEDTLAAVLAHELAHVEQRHALLALSQKKRDETSKALGTIAESLSCGNVLQQALAVMNAAVDEITQRLLQAGYSREQEFVADARAVKILSAAGYDPGALGVILSALAADGRHESRGWFATHPPATERLAAARTVSSQVTGRDRRRERQERFARAFARFTRA